MTAPQRLPRPRPTAKRRAPRLRSSAYRRPHYEIAEGSDAPRLRPEQFKT